jgi:hypothetical protein
VVCIACILIFPTAQMLSLSDLSPAYRLVATAFAFAAMASALMFYVRCCLLGRVAEAKDGGSAGE